jgi:hypothetical protein
MEETVLINVKLEGTENDAKINSLSKSINELNEENKKLVETNKTLAKASGDNSAEIAKNSSNIELNKQKIGEATAVRKSLINVIVAEDNSIKALTVRNAELRKQRDLINTSTEEGRKRISLINQELDKNNKTIKDNNDALGKQKINIGNYASALDSVVPGLGGMVTGIQAATKAGLTFIATPLGATLAGIALALSTVIKFFKGSEEGEDALAKITNRLSFVFEQLGQVVEVVGEILFKTFTFVSETGFKILELVAPAAANAIGAATDAADAITKLQDDIENRENELIVKRAQTNKQVQELREKAITQEGDAKRKSITEAISLEKILAKEEADQLRDKLKALDKEIAAEGNATEAQKKLRAEAVAAIIDAESQAAEATIRFQKQLESLNDAEIKNLEKLSEEAAKLAADKYKKTIDSLQKLSDARIKAESDEVEGQKKLQEEYKKTLEDLSNLVNKKDEYNQITDLSGLIAEQEISDKQEQTEVNKQYNAQVADGTKKAKLNDTQKKESIKAAIALSAATIGLAENESKVGKSLALSTIAVNSAIGVSAAVRAGAELTFPANLVAILSGITAVLTGITQAKSILKFAQGGMILSGPSHAMGGIPFSVGGRAGFEAEGGEAIINKRSTAMYAPILSQINQAGGGNAFATGGIAGNEVRSAYNFAQMFPSKSVPVTNTVLVLEDFEAKSSSKYQTINKAQVL